MKKISVILTTIFLLTQLVFCSEPIEMPKQNKSNPNLSFVKLPDGFTIDYYVENLTNARSMTRSPSGVLYVGTRSAGNVYALVDLNNDYKVDQVFTIASGLNMPNGVAFHNGDLFVAEVNRILKFKNIEANLSSPPPPEIVFDKFPTITHHGWKFIRIGPDGKLYVPIGAPCNICDEGDPFATITRMNLDGTDWEIFARGVRNTVGFDWHPITKDLWFTDNGRDWMGDDLPPCELNHAPEKGMHFGYPYVHGLDILDPEFGKGKKASDYTPAAQPLGPHVAPLGMRFYSGNMFPEMYSNQIFIAERGSWNRSKKIGYRVVLVTLENNKPMSYEPFIDGFMRDEKVFGRPVDVEILPDGSMLVSDDTANCIYRITYSANK